MDNLHTVAGETAISLEIKKSRFIAHLVPIADFRTTLERLREQHKKARHFVWATRQLNDRQQIVEHCSDDGEPRNTSGQPTLKALQGQRLINAALITVRYFGGIKLGSGGLVRAYNDAAQQAIVEAKPIPLARLHRATVRIPYQQIRHAEYQLQQHAISVLGKDFAADHVALTLQGEEALIAEAFARLGSGDPIESEPADGH